MNEYLFLMHAGMPADAAHTWPAYLAALRPVGAFEGGSAIGDGLCVAKTGPELVLASTRRSASSWRRV